MKKLKHEAELVQKALQVGDVYAQKRGVGKFEGTDSKGNKIEYIYRLLVNDKLVQPLAKGDETQPNMKHKLALWLSRQLPEDHPLLQE
jgi:predicted transcriptional regulator